VRLVSLLPSATEIVYALGLGDDLVGVTFECDEPAAARSEKTVVVGGRDTRGMTPGEIDSYVRTQVAAGEDLYTLHARALAELAPDLILTQDLCRVCALPSDQVQDALDYLGCQADVLSLDPYSLAEVLDTIRAVGERAGVPDRAALLHHELSTRLSRVAAAVAGRPGQRSVQTSWADISASKPDLIIVAPCGYHLDGAIEQARVVARALPGVPVWAIDADGIVVRPGPRLVNGVEAIAWILHPGAVPAPPPHAVYQLTGRGQGADTLRRGSADRPL
jgi:iron complex transport system substrate-binding protein